MDKEHATEIKISIYSFFGVILFEFAAYFAKGESPNPEIIKDIIIFGFLLSIFLITLYRLPYLPRLFELFHKSSKQIEEISNVQLTGIIKKMEDIESDHKVSKVTNHISSLNTISKDFGMSVYKDYIERFKLVTRGFSVEGEQFALSSYAAFWKKLNEEQIIRQALGKPCMIARVTHSNEIVIWEPNLEPRAYKQSKLSLYNSQKEFIQNGGIIVRILIGREKEPNENYRNIINKMKEIGIEVKYFDDNIYNVPDYDFLFLADESVVLKWYSSSTNKNLTGFEVQDTVEEEVKEVWNTIYNILKDGGDPITSIPEDRKII